MPKTTLLKAPKALFHVSFWPLPVPGQSSVGGSGQDHGKVGTKSLLDVTLEVGTREDEVAQRGVVLVEHEVRFFLSHGNPPSGHGSDRRNVRLLAKHVHGAPSHRIQISHRVPTLGFTAVLALGCGRKRCNPPSEESP